MGDRDRTRRDAHEKVTGKAQYAGDIRIEGMLYARIFPPPPAHRGNPQVSLGRQEHLRPSPEGRPRGADCLTLGDLKQGEARAKTVLESAFLNNNVAHAPMEPPAAIARIEGNKITIWASTQSPFGATPEDVRVTTPSSAEASAARPGTCRSSKPRAWPS